MYRITVLCTVENEEPFYESIIIEDETIDKAYKVAEDLIAGDYPGCTTKAISHKVMYHG